MILSSQYAKHDAVYMDESEECDSWEILEATKILNKYGMHSYDDPHVFRECDQYYNVC